MSTPHTEGRVTLLGSGTCRIDPLRAPTSACVVMGTTTYIIDLGCGALERLELVGAFDVCRELHIHISHSHIDHAFGLFPLLQCLTWSDDARHLQIARVVIHATTRVCTMIQRTLSLWDDAQTRLLNGYPGCAERRLEFCAGPDTKDWHYDVGPLRVTSAHLPAHQNHGASFSCNGKTYAFTCDATELSDELITFCSLVDVCVFDLGHLSSLKDDSGRFSLSLDHAAKLLATTKPKKAYAAHIYLRHLQDRKLYPTERAHEAAQIIQSLANQARTLGFTGQLIAAEDAMAL